MACCGQRRQQIRQQLSVQRVSSPALPGDSDRPRTHQSAVFQYVGKTALTAVGSATGQHYRFSHPMAIVEVDPRDRASLATVPNLRQI